MRRRLQIIILITLTTLYACSQPTTETTIPTDHNPDSLVQIISASITKTNYRGHEYPLCFEAAFADSTFVTEITTQDTILYPFKTIDLGKIKVTSGKIIACDPIVMHDSKPFTNIFPTGQFSSQLAIAKIPNNNRVAYVRIVFSNKPVAKWKYATRQGEKQIPINDTTLYCFGVDAGQGIFIDSIANSIFSKKEQAEWIKTFTNSKWFSPDYYGCIHSFDNLNMAIFTTGYGDGCYGSFIGLDHDNQVCRLLTDFGFIWWWKDKTK